MTGSVAGARGMFGELSVKITRMSAFPLSAISAAARFSSDALASVVLANVPSR